MDTQKYGCYATNDTDSCRKLKFPEFAWFEELRPTDPQDVFHWRGKGEGSALKVIQRRRSPQQKVNIVSR